MCGGITMLFFAILATFLSCCADRSVFNLLRMTLGISAPDSVAKAMELVAVYQ